MARQPEHEDDTEHRKNEEASAPPPKLSRLRIWIKTGGRFVAEGFAPVVSIVALVVAVIAVSGNQANQSQFKEGLAKVNGMNAGLLAIKNDLEKFRVALAQEKTLQDDERKKLDESLTKIVQGVTRVQVKLKVSPTVEEQLRQTDGPPAATPPASGAKTNSPMVAPAADASSAEKKHSPQVKTMMEAIKNYNKQ
jgi:hypothetical protein